MFSLEERQIFTALMAVEGISSKTLHKILRAAAKTQYSLGEVWQLSRQSRFLEKKLSKRHPLSGLSLRTRTAMQSFFAHYTPESYFGFLLDNHYDVVLETDDSYPKMLFKIDDRPFLLFTKGYLPALNFPSIAVVGTRHPTGYGRVATTKIVREVVAYDVAITSGFMYGIDAIAHRTALAESGTTIAVLAFGFSHLTPTSHRHLFDQVVSSGGCCVTEYAPAVSARVGTFPARNRLIAGMTRATVVTEAAERSGSHHTAHWARNFDRPVCAVPGPITSLLSEGTKGLVQQGAHLVSSGEEVLRIASLWSAEEGNS